MTVRELITKLEGLALDEETLLDTEIRIRISDVSGQYSQVVRSKDMVYEPILPTDCKKMVIINCARYGSLDDVKGTMLLGH